MNEYICTRPQTVDVQALDDPMRHFKT